MAAIDKINEFYTCLKRFAFLSEYYAPEEIEHRFVKAFEAIQEYSRLEFVQKKIEESEEYFDEKQECIEMHKRKDLLAYIITECTR